ncbi:uncharacterized protein SOCE26_059810 [Sorangium cellulosum]|uniref:Uncharacterized protein n=1 Tax=Sorangium cellulosum TaxID=56 RepID=A0A2L0EYY8_SORCE|nr:hypothetical protein [Sorangium cellulosum]AUX44517.1 uncharacterized protein SOCE26_059810 [Sorangium cellulosum]
MTDNKGRPHGKLKRLGLGLAAAAALFGLFRVGAAAWGESRLRAYREATEAEWNAARARIHERSGPAGEGAARDGCVASYARTTNPELGIYNMLVKQALDAGPGAPLPPKLVPELERRRPELDAFRQAARCSHYELADDVAWVDYTPVHPILFTSRLVVIEGHGLAAKGDVRGALDRYLSVAKVGEDMAAGPMIAGIIGSDAARHAYVGIAALTAGAPRLAEAELAAVDRELAERGRRLPLLAEALHKERLQLRKEAMSPRIQGALPDHVSSPALSPGVVALTVLFPTEAVFGHVVPMMDARLRRAEQIARDAERAPSAAARFQEVATDALVTEATWLGGILDPEQLQRLARRDCALRASYHLARAAIAAERAHADGRYPEALPSLAQDPCGTGPLVYSRSPDGTGYTLSSVGENGQADGPREGGGATGESDDLVITRRGSYAM